jgi:hypothetical protein
VFGGADGIRTHDLLDAIEARSQLRHGPTVGKFLQQIHADFIAGSKHGQSALRFCFLPQCDPSLADEKYGTRSGLQKLVSLPRQVEFFPARICLPAPRNHSLRVVFPC